LNFLRLGMRRFTTYLCLFFCQCALLSALLLVSSQRREARLLIDADLGQLTRTLGLTDLALWSEARYTRNPSQADFFSAFQNAPGCLDSFPAGSFVPPPPYLLKPR